MIQDIIDGIVAALLSVFPNMTIYTEEVKQGLKEPCFVLQSVKPTREQFLGNRYYRTNLFSVQYFPQSKNDAKAECNSVTEKLFQALEYIMVSGDLQRGTGMNAEYFDGVLTFLVNFNLFVRSKTVQESMDAVTVNSEAN